MSSVGPTQKARIPSDAAGQVNARILLWGIDGSGKSTTLQTIHDKLQPDLRGEITRTPTRLDPTVHYESMSISLGRVGGVTTQIEIIAVPGAADQAMTRKQLLDEVDGIILTLDCSPERLEANSAGIEELSSSLGAYGQRLDAFPLVLQYNKRDIADPFAIEDLHRRLELPQAAVFETIATTGHGILSTLTTISKHVVRNRRAATNAERDISPPAAVPSSAPASTPESAPASPPVFAAAAQRSEQTHDILEAAILAEGDAEELAEVGFESTSNTQPIWDATSSGEGFGDDGSSDGGFREDGLSDALFAADMEDIADLADAEKAKPQANFGGALRIVSAGQVSVEADGGLRVPLVLGDENGETRSVVLSLRLDALLDRETR